MRHSRACLVALGLLVATTSATAQDSSSEGLIVTTGSASGAMPPTAARLSLGIGTRASSASAAAADNGKRLRQLLAALGRLGFGSRDARMTSYQVSMDEDYETGKLRGYEALTEVEVAISDLATLGSVIDSALAAGATGVSDIDFVAESLPQLRLRLLAEALAGARRDAEALAVASGGHLGELVALSTIPFSQGIDYLQAGVVRSAGFATIGPRDVKVQTTVYARWRLSR